MNKLLPILLIFSIFIGCAKQPKVEKSPANADELPSDIVLLAEIVDSLSPSSSKVTIINKDSIRDKVDLKYLFYQNIDRLKIANLPDKVVIMFVAMDSTNIVLHNYYTESEGLTTESFNGTKAIAIIIDQKSNDYKQLVFTRDFLFKNLSDSLLENYDIASIHFNSYKADTITFEIVADIFDTDLGYSFYYRYPESTDTIEWHDSLEYFYTDEES